MALETASTPTTQPASAQAPATPPKHARGWTVPLVILILAAVLLFTITSNWNSWIGGSARQTTDDAYLHADLTPLSTKVSGVVAKVNVSDYQHVKAGDLVVQLKDDDFKGIRLSNAPVVRLCLVLNLSDERSGISTEATESGRGGEAGCGV